MSVHAAGAPEGVVKPKSSSCRVAIGAPLRTNRRLEEVLAIGFAKMQLCLGANTAMNEQGEASGVKNKREDDGSVPSGKRPAPTPNNLYQIDFRKNIVTAPSLLRDQHSVDVDDDEDLPLFKAAALAAIYDSLNENISAVAQPDEKKIIERKVAAIVNDTNSWVRQSANMLMRGGDIETTPEYSRELVAILKRMVLVKNATEERFSWNPHWNWEFYLSHTEEISQYLATNAEWFFKDLIQKFNEIEPRADVTKEYCVNYRFDTTSWAHNKEFHMDELSNRRQYGHGPQGDDYNFFADIPVYSVAFCYDDNLNPFECGTEVLLGTPTLTPSAMYKLSHVDGGAFTARELYQMWNYEKNVTPVPRVNDEWEKSAWQELANVMQLATEQMIETVGLEDLYATGNYQLHKVRNHHLHNYVSYVYHRADNTSVYPDQWDVRGFVTIDQLGKLSGRKYHSVLMQLDDGHDVRVNIAWN